MTPNVTPNTAKAATIGAQSTLPPFTQISEVYATSCALDSANNAWYDGEEYFFTA